MAASMNPKIQEVLPNFRRVYPRPANNDVGNLKGALFRTSCPDYLSQEHAEMIRESGIKTIVDFRPVKEYLAGRGDKTVDKYYAIYYPKEPFLRVKVRYEVEEPVKLLRAQSTTQEHVSTNKNLRHICMDFFKLNYIVYMLRSAPIVVVILSIIQLLKDLLDFRAKFYHNFVAYFAKNFFNVQGLLKQYINMVEHSQASICAALKILSEPGSLPALINCAHGKDRTGIVTAIILWMMGVPRDEIIQDYSISERSLECVKERLHHEICERYHMAAEFKGSKPETMRGLLEHLDRKYGSIERYLDHIGFGADERQRLRDNLNRTSGGN